MFLQNKYFTSALIDYEAEMDFDSVHSLSQSDALDIWRVQNFRGDEIALFETFEDNISRLFNITYDEIRSKSLFESRYERVSQKDKIRDL